MDVTDYIDAIRQEGELLADSAEAAGPATPVPTCPDWQVRDLLRHIGGVQRWATSHVEFGRTQPYGSEEEARFFDAPGDEELVGWFRTGCAKLAATLAAADPDTACFQFLSAPSPLAFWARRQAHELAVHRADADAAAGRTSRYSPAFAADGVAELIDGFHNRRHGRLVADPAVSLGVHGTDADCAWTIRIGPDRRVVVNEVKNADCVLAGPANDLYLALWNRRGLDGLAVHGNSAVLDVWRERAHITWA